MSSQQNRSVGEGIVSSTLWVGSWRWSARLIGFVTTVILARLLLPEDFGIVATALVVVAFFDILIDLGTDNYLIRLQSPDVHDYNTAWTLRLLVVTAASIVLFSIAVPVAAYFNDQRLVDVVRVLAIASLLRGFCNIGLTMYRRELQYRKIAYVGLGQRLTGSAITIVLAFVFENYWAMVIGEVALRLAELLLGYYVHPFRPRFSLAKIAKQWCFCQWIVVRNLATFLQSQGDNLVVAKYFGIELMGVYAMAMRLALLPTKQLIGPMLSPVYSGLSKKQHEPELFKRSVLQVTGATTAIILPAATLVASLSQPLVTAIFGDKWQAVTVLVAPLVFAVAAVVLCNPAVTALTILGRVKLLAVLHWVSALALITAMYLVASYANLQWVAQIRALIAFLILLLYYGWLCHELNIPLRHLLSAIYRSCLACLLMAWLTLALSSTFSSAWLTILLSGSLGGLLYLSCVYVLWRLAGMPDSGDVLLIKKLLQLFTRKLGIR